MRKGIRVYDIWNTQLDFKSVHDMMTTLGFSHPFVKKTGTGWTRGTGVRVRRRVGYYWLESAYPVNTAGMMMSLFYHVARVHHVPIRVLVK